MNHAPTARLAACIPLIIATNQSNADTLSGIVYDYGQGLTNTSGIELVLITVHDHKQKTLTSGITDKNGRYKIELPADISMLKFLGATIHYQKIGYRSYPTIRPLLDREEKPVPLAKENADSSYYESVALQLNNSAFIRSSNVDSEIALISSLPEGSRTKISTYLDNKAEPWVIEKLNQANSTRDATLKINNEIIKENKFNHINVIAYPNFPTTGTVWLMGVVKEDSTRKSIEELTTTINRHRVKNDIITIHETAHRDSKQPKDALE
ncbi:MULTISPECIES: hypothetical protein [unclassified Pseudomonas]|uniref:hypothetical protein n=1 Tax=unclassified Pseudomonas TaxID=196821 RepID=UPI00190DED98|nr:MULTISPECIES: hypothetical protein [unclassified Pseudomonas]MBK3468739.1 hypothetical protein [Pseudomonas sp. MF6776]